MRRTPFHRLLRLAGASLLTAVALAAWSPPLSRAEDASPKSEDADAEPALPPEAEAKLKEFVDKVVEAKGRLWTDRMKREIQEVVKITGVSEEAVKALDAPASQAVAACLKDWTPKARTALMKQFRVDQNPEDALNILEQVIVQVEEYAKYEWTSDYTHPFEHALWTDAVRRTLTAEQAAVWDKAQADQKQALEKEIDEFLKNSADRMQDQFATANAAKAGRLKQDLSLTKERSDALDALAKSLADRKAGRWKDRGRRMLVHMEESLRRMYMKEGRFYMASDEKDEKEDRAAWDDGVAKLLTPEETQTLQRLNAERKARRARALGRMLVALMDDKAAFTSEQRTKLEPIAESAVANQKRLFPDGETEYFYSFSPFVFYSATVKAPEERVKPLLDELQWAHWRAASKVKDPSVRRVRIGRAQLQAVESAEDAPVKPDEPEEVEKAISSFLYGKALEERSRCVKTMMLKAEDVARVVSLTAPVAARLQTAARGAAEDLLKGWRENAEQNVRAQLQGATAANIRQKIASLEDYMFNSRSSSGNRDLWEKTVDAELTEEQRKAWRGQVDERTAYRDRAIAAVILAEFDRRHLLTTQQWEKLEPAIAQVMKEYGSDFSSMFSPSNSIPWYLQNYTMFMPLAGVPEAELKEILGKEQWERWAGSNECGNSHTYWENVRGNHDRRVEAAKKKQP